MHVLFVIFKLAWINIRWACEPVGHWITTNGIIDGSAQAIMEKVLQTKFQSFKGKAGIWTFWHWLNCISKYSLAQTAQQTSVQKHHTNIGHCTDWHSGRCKSYNLQVPCSSLCRWKYMVPPPTQTFSFSFGSLNTTHGYPSWPRSEKIICGRWYRHVTLSPVLWSLSLSGEMKGLVMPCFKEEGCSCFPLSLKAYSQISKVVNNGVYSTKQTGRNQGVSKLLYTSTIWLFKEKYCICSKMGLTGECRETKRLYFECWKIHFHFHLFICLTTKPYSILITKYLILFLAAWEL